MANLEYGTTGVVDEGSNSLTLTLTPSDTLVEINGSILEPKRTKLHQERRIEKVPLAMREDEKAKKYFDPWVVSIGPYHHGKKELQSGERLKSNVAELYIVNSGRRMDEFRSKILETVYLSRSYYLEGSTEKYSDKEFVEMMVIDGLFVLAYMDNIMNRDENFTKEQQKHLGSNAMLLLPVDVFNLVENQLPFQVLELLLNLKSEHKNFTIFLELFWDATQIMEFGHSKHEREKKGPKEEFRKRIDNKQLLHLPEYFWWQDLNKFSQSSHVPDTSNEDPFLDLFYSFRSISELKAKGIRARPGNAYNKMDIKFRPFLFFFAELEIPPLLLTPDFVVSSTNLIAHEWMPNNPDGHQPTMTYINFMKSLINSAEDVKELRERNILFSPCSSDEEVVEMINSIPTMLIEDYGAYKTVKQGIKKHSENKAKTSIAELIHKYFDSPWAFIAFLAGTALIIMSILQTYFTIYPRK